jgi:hypothetical protein
MSRMDQPKSDLPKEIVELLPPDASRIAKMKDQATNEFNPAVNPVARSYAERVQERMASKVSADTLKTRSSTLGHVAMPPKEKFEQIAALNMPHPSFGDDEVPQGVPGAPARPPEPIHVQQPPKPVGVGSAYTVNQEMAAGRLDRPVSLREAKNMEQGKKGLSQETLKAISLTNDSLAKNVADPQADQAEKETIAKAIQDSAPTPEPTSGRDLDKAEKKIVDGREPLFPDFEGVLQTMGSQLMSKERRKKIEDRLEPLDLSDMIIKRELTQEVPVVPGKLAFTLRTLSQKESLWILQYLYDFTGSAMFTRELLSTCQMVCAVMAINGSMLPDHRQGGEVDKKAFEKKKEALAAFPTQLIAEISVQLMWFQDRVNQLFGLDAIKNG